MDTGHYRDPGHGMQEAGALMKGQVFPVGRGESNILKNLAHDAGGPHQAACGQQQVDIICCCHLWVR